MLRALYEVVSKSGATVSDLSKSSILEIIDRNTDERSDSTAIAYARLFGALLKNLPASDASVLIKHRVLTVRFNNAAVLNLNSILLESPSSLIDGLAQETASVICQGIQIKQPFISDNYILAAGKYLLSYNKNKSYGDATPLFETLASVIPPGNPIDLRRVALMVIRTISRQHYSTVEPHLSGLVPPIFASVRDPVIPVKLAAEAAFLALLAVVEEEKTVFDNYMAGSGAEINPTIKRAMGDYFNRVALRLATQARERKEAEGGQGGLGLSNDEKEDEREIWSVGKVDLGENTLSMINE